jgi:hypothetical protein
MESDKVFTGISPVKIQWGKKEIFWLSGIWVAFIVFSYRATSFIPIVTLAVFTIISIVIRLPVFQVKIYIKISNGILSIQNKDGILWTSQLKDIVSIELEESKKSFPAFSYKALLIRNNKEDSYFLPLDSIGFEGVKPAELVDELNQFKDRV